MHVWKLLSEYWPFKGACNLYSCKSCCRLEVWGMPVLQWWCSERQHCSNFVCGVNLKKTLEENRRNKHFHSMLWKYPTSLLCVCGIQLCWGAWLMHSWYFAFCVLKISKFVALIWCPLLFLFRLTWWQQIKNQAAPQAVKGFRQSIDNLWKSKQVFLQCPTDLGSDGAHKPFTRPKT